MLAPPQTVDDLPSHKPDHLDLIRSREIRSNPANLHIIQARFFFFFLP